MTRLLCCSDLHNGVEIAERLAARVRNEELDGSVVAGDLGDWLHHDERLWRALGTAGKPVYCVAGNHDVSPEWSQLIGRHSFTDLGGRVVRVGGAVLAGWAWQWSEEGVQPEEGPDPKLERLRARLNGVDHREVVLVTHLPPWGARVARTDDDEDIGDDWVRELSLRKSSRWPS